MITQKKWNSIHWDFEVLVEILKFLLELQCMTLLEILSQVQISITPGWERERQGFTEVPWWLPWKEKRGIVKSVPVDINKLSAQSWNFPCWIKECVGLSDASSDHFGWRRGDQRKHSLDWRFPLDQQLIELKYF